jgi:tetratricopeptide (TPR) repeat protein
VLFDLSSGRRKRVVQVVYGTLAVLFLLGFVFFGVGSGGIGGITDLLNGGGSGSSASSAFDSQISHAQAQLKKDPQNPTALLHLASYEVQASGVSTAAQTGQALSTDTQNRLNAAFDAWDKYLKTNPKKPDSALAPQIGLAFALTGDFTGAIQAQKIVADSQPSASSIGQLAIYYYANGDFKAGDAASKQAIAKSPKASRPQTKTILKQKKTIAERFAKAQKAQAQAQASGGNGSSSPQIQNPFSGLAPSTTPTTP